MKNLSITITAILAGLSFNTFGQTTSYGDNDLNRAGFANVYLGSSAGLNATGSLNTFTGTNTGLNNSGSNNIFTGFNAGQNSTSGSFNIFTGSQAGLNNAGGEYNIFTGWRAGAQNSTGDDNVIIGRNTGENNTTGSQNIFIGTSAGGLNQIGNNNVAIGNRAGFRSGGFGSDGANNVFIGHYAGQNERGSSKLYIDDSDANDLADADTPLIYGDFEENQLVFHGKVSTGIGNTNFPTTVGGLDISNYTLFVQGGLLTESVRITTGWADYVFEDAYKLKSLTEVETFINENGHLPNVPSAKEVEASGIEMGEITKIQQEKIEELTLYLIEMSKDIQVIKQENLELKEALVNLQK